jgi:MFS family permease
MSNSKWINLWVAYLALVGAFLPYVGWSPSLGAITDDLSLSYSQAGSLSSVTGLVAGTMILVGGLLAVRWGSKNVILAGLIAGAAGQALFAMSDGYELLIAARMLAGLSVGFLWVATYTMAVDWFRDSNQTGRALGIMMSGDGLGALLGLFAFAAVLSVFGWRLGLTVQAVCLLAVFVLVLLVARNAPLVAGPLIQTDQPLPRRVEESAGRNWVRVVLNRNILLATVFWIGGVGLFSAVATWLPTILVEDGGFSESLAGLTTSMFSIAGMAAALAGPFIAERVGGKKPVIVGGGVATAVAVAVMTVFIATDNYVGLALFVPVIGLGVYAAEPLILAEALDSVSARHAGVVNGIILGVPWIVSGFAYPYVLGAVKDATDSFVAGFVAVTVATFLLCALSSLFIKNHPVPSETSTADA